MKTVFNSVLTPKQYLKAANYKNQRLTRKIPTRWLIWLMSMSMVAAPFFLLAYSAEYLDGPYSPLMMPVWIATLILFSAMVLYRVFYYLGFNRLLRRNGRFVGTAITLSLEETGLRTSGSYGEGFTPWKSMEGVEMADDVLLLMLDNFYFIPVSASAFDSLEEKDAFVAHVRQRISGATDTFHAASSVSEETPERVTASAVKPGLAAAGKMALKTFFKSMGQAFKLAIFLPVAEERISVAWWQIPVFALLGILLSSLWDFSIIGLGGEFEWYSLPSALFHLPVLLVAAVSMAYGLRRSDKIPLLFQVFLMISLALDLTATALLSLIPRVEDFIFEPMLGDAYFSFPSIWLAVACLVAARRYTMPGASRRLLAAALTLLLIALPLGAVYRVDSLWRLPYSEDADRYQFSLTNEDIFYSQQKLLERELANLQPERNGVTDVFFVGMAGYADQDVFMKEVDSVAHLFRERFDADGHIIRLVNNNKTLATSPIASTTSLKITLDRVGRVMNKDEDVLFLYLTSHASQSFHFSLELWPLRFNLLDPARLRKLLDDSGIRNRVIVVSSCYSGGFINALKDDRTLVISASAPDKNSFGCSNENDWTYFGDAYFNHGLRQSHSFIDAFNLATPMIAAREKKEEFDPSNPQISIGKGIRDTLAALEEELKIHQQGSLQPVSMETKPNPGDKIEQYVNLVFDPATVKESYESCLDNMYANGPDAQLERNPNYFSGLNKSSPHWPELANAWNRYSESYCEKLYGGDLMRNLYTRFIRANISARELTPVLRFLNSDSGKHWYPAEKEAMRQLTAALAKTETEINAPLYKTYQDEQERIFKEFSTGQKGSGNKTQ